MKLRYIVSTIYRDITSLIGLSLFDGNSVLFPMAVRCTEVQYACFTIRALCCHSSFSLVINVAIGDSNLPKFYSLNTDLRSYRIKIRSETLFYDFEIRGCIKICLTLCK